MALRRILTSFGKNQPGFKLLYRQKVYANDLIEPDYLDELRPKVPVYDTIDIQIKGHDFRILENYQRYIHRLAENMEIEVEDSWATPLERIQVQRFKPNSSVIDSEYTLETYERNIQIVDVAATTFSTFLRVAEAALPEGVNMQAREHLPEYDEILFVPDKQLRDLKEELENVGTTGKKK